MEIPLPTLLEEGYEQEIDVLDGLFELSDKQQLYWCTLAPKNIKAVERVVVYLHGFAGSSGYLEFNAMATMAKLGNCAMIGVDMLGHGRSDGLHVYIEGWHPFVDSVSEFVQKFCTAKSKEWSEEAGKTLKMFGMGESMGGGVLATMSLKAPSTFDGIILYSPMLAVSPEAFPPAPVVWLFKNLLCPILPDWPIAPNKDITGMSYSDPAMVKLWRENPFGAEHTAPRLQTALSLAFEAPEWLAPRLQDLDTPFLIIHAANDRVTDPQLSQQLHDVARAADKQIELYPDAEHMDPLHGGPTKRELVQRVFHDVFAWLNARS